MVVFGTRRDFGFYCSSLSSLFGKHGTLCSEIFGGGKFLKKFVEPGFGVLLFQMWWFHLPMGFFDTCLNEKEHGGVTEILSIFRA